MYTPQKTNDRAIIDRVQQIESWWNPYMIEGTPNTLTKEWFRKWHPWRLETDRPIIDAAIGMEKSGSSLLDIACNDGWYSFKAREAGFNVTGVEIRPEVVERAKLLQSYFGHDGINFLEGDVQQDGTVDGQFDVSLFYGILYHLRDPIGALEKIGQLTKRLICVQTFIHALDGRPTLYLKREDPFEEGNSITRLITTPTQRAVVIMLREAGFDHVYRAMPSNYIAKGINSTAAWQWSFFYGVKGDPLPDLPNVVKLNENDAPLNSFGPLSRLYRRSEWIARRIVGKDAGSDRFAKTVKD